jgi:hypothetical protein
MSFWRRLEKLIEGERNGVGTYVHVASAWRNLQTEHLAAVERLLCTHARLSPRPES